MIRSECILDRFTVSTTPFRWAQTAPQALGPAASAELEASFPTIGFRSVQRDAATGAAKSYATESLPLYEGRPRSAFHSLTPRWRELIELMVAPTFRSGLGDVLGCDLTGALVEVRATRYGPGHFMGAHTDRADKIATLLWYFNDSWCPAWGGHLDILRSGDPRDVAVSVPPAGASAAAIVRSDTSWHAVRPVAPAARTARRALLIHYRHDQSRGRP